MYIKLMHRAIAPLLLACVLFVTACGNPAPPPISTNPTSTSQTATSSQPSSTPAITAKTKTAPTAPAKPAPKTVATPEAAPLKDISGLTPQKGGAFNKFFPDAKGTDYERTFTQEKEGFAEIKLTLKGAEMAQISISDTVTNLTARSKFAGTTEKISGFPVIAQGKNAQAVLVGDRYQVKVMSRAATFTEANRKEWLAKVNLAGLAKLK